MLPKRTLGKDDLLQMYNYFLLSSALDPEDIIVDGLCMKVLSGELERVSFMSVWIPRGSRLTLDAVLSDNRVNPLPDRFQYHSSPEVAEPEGIFCLNGIYGSSFIFTPIFNVTIH